MAHERDEGSRSFPDWSELYRQESIETMPWYYPTLDPDLAEALERIRKADKESELRIPA